MTNDQKARAIIGEDCKKENCLECGGRYSAEESGCAMYQKIMQMAQWKDEQLANCIECLEKEYIRNSGKGLYDNNEIAAKLATLKRIEEEMSKIHNQN